jgi:hypothetical protein
MLLTVIFLQHPPITPAVPGASPRGTSASGGLFQTPLAGAYGRYAPCVSSHTNLCVMFCRPSFSSSTPQQPNSAQQISSPSQLVYKLQAEASEHRNEELSRLLEKVQLLKESKAREEEHISKQVEEREKEAAKAKSYDSLVVALALDSAAFPGKQQSGSLFR